ncbi:DegT/DnrJ/EryC1/StrS family aminotransferase [Desulfomarina sp.]
MKVPLLDLRAQLEYLEDDLIEAVTRVVRSTRYIQGPEVTGLEEEIAQYCGTEYGVAVSSGTDALLISLMSVGIGQGDLVLTTPYSFFATMGVILRVGAVPVFADIDPVSYNIDPENVAEILEKDRGQRIKAIIPVHLYGQCADMDRLMEIAGQYNIPVIEDAAQAIGAEYPSGNGDSIQYGRAGSFGLCGCFSFFPSKNLGGIGDGGMVVTNDREFAEKLVLMRNHGAWPKYYHSMVGGNFRMDPIQSAALRVKLPYLDRWHSERGENAEAYNRYFTETKLVEEGIVQLPVSVYDLLETINAEDRNHHIYNQYILRVKERDRLRDWLVDNDIGCEIYYPVPLHRQECLGREISSSSCCPEAEKAAEETIALPIYPELTRKMQRHIVQTIVRFYT